MGQSFLDSCSSTNSSGQAFSHTKPNREFDRPADKSASTGCRQLKVGGLEGSGWEKLIEGWSSAEVKLLESSWRESTLKTYRQAWSRWCNWAHKNKVLVDNPEAHSVAKYLCHLYETIQLAPKSIALNRSVVVNFSNPLRSEELSSHPLIKRVLRGIFAANPSTKKPITWEIEDLINYLRTYEVNKNSIFAVSRHTSILLLLASGRRVHDLTLLTINDGAFEDKGDSLIFWPKFGSKTDSSFYQQSGWLLQKETENEDLMLDLVFWVRTLIALSADRRKNVDNLFITTRGSAKCASRSVIAGWIRTLFKEAGISASAGKKRIFRF
ncbi:PREDICTED: uncharacterized protein LOC108366379 [Rhagoletis zephyria]|uniref:uncharacterized protein LOC108366379 n=1 Tax=Rhagoletis zephyria TaxID=28612 RepID=UPI00081132D3|nr:PREDICTED: uncharacterized protein LOC108366379 [Rhagoletis zephyria]